MRNEILVSESIAKVWKHAKFLTVSLIGGTGLFLAIAMYRPEAAPLSAPTLRMIRVANVFSKVLMLASVGFWASTAIVLYRCIKVRRTIGVKASWLWLIPAVLGTPIGAMVSAWLFLAVRKVRRDPTIL
jgi:hypothetical protein